MKQKEIIYLNDYRKPELNQELESAETLEMIDDRPEMNDRAKSSNIGEKIIQISYNLNSANRKSPEEENDQESLRRDSTHWINVIKTTDMINGLGDMDSESKNKALNENANKNAEYFGTGRDLQAGVLSKERGLEMLPKRVMEAHKNADIHFHDLDYNPYSPMTNCCLVDFEGMLEKGFNMGNASCESPKSIQTACAQASQIIANVASSQYGGTTFPDADIVLGKYAELNYQKHLKTAEKWVAEELREDYANEKTKKDIKDGIQSLEYEINTLFTSNGQTPFTTIGFGLGEGKWEKEVQKAIFNQRIEGLGEDKRTAIFPKLVFAVKDGLNKSEGDPNYDVKKLALECSTKRMYPDILNYDKVVETTGSFKYPMGCRSFLGEYTNPQTGDSETAGRMNLGVVSLNLPRIALESDGDQEKFWQILDDKLDVVHEALKFRIDRCKQAKPGNAPILYQNGAFGKRLDVDGDVDELFKNNRASASLGYTGLYEVGAAFFGGEWEQNPEAKEFTLDVLHYLNAAAEEWKADEGYGYSVYSTPAESLTDRFCSADREKFGEIKDITDKEYYTNSFHYDVRKNPSPFEKIDFEKDYLPMTPGGQIVYCEYPKMQQNPKALEAVWDYSFDKVMYLGTNTPIDHCYECGSEEEFKPTERGFECSDCGNHDPKTSDVVKRTCGYLGNPQARPMVKGRHKEISARKKHMK